jgi:DNA polymerase
MEDAAEQLSRLAQAVGECEQCRARGLRPVPGGGHPHCSVMVVSLQPGPTDGTGDRPGGSTLVEDLAEFMPALATAVDQIYVTTLFKCAVHDGQVTQAPTTAELDACFPFFSRELSITTPHYILVVGEQTARYVLGKLFRDLPYREGDSLELRVFVNPAFKIVPVAEPQDLRRRAAPEREEYCRRLATLAQVMGL